MLHESSNDPRKAGTPEAGALPAKVYCDSLMAAIAAMEQALDRPAPLAEALRATMGTVRANLQQHFLRSESPEGLLPRVASDRPRFAGRTDALRDEHVQMQVQFDLLAAALAGNADEKAVRQQADILLQQLRGHLEKGSRLISDAYVRDVGSGD